MSSRLSKFITSLKGYDIASLKRRQVISNATHQMLSAHIGHKCLLSKWYVLYHKLKWSKIHVPVKHILNIVSASVG